MNDLELRLALKAELGVDVPVESSTRLLLRRLLRKKRSRTAASHRPRKAESSRRQRQSARTPTNSSDQENASGRVGLSQSHKFGLQTLRSRSGVLVSSTGRAGYHCRDPKAAQTLSPKPIAHLDGRRTPQSKPRRHRHPLQTPPSGSSSRSNFIVPETPVSELPSCCSQKPTAYGAVTHESRLGQQTERTGVVHQGAPSCLPTANLSRARPAGGDAVHPANGDGTDLAQVMAELAKSRHRCQIAEEQLRQQQLEALEKERRLSERNEHINELCRDLELSFTQPSCITDTCFLAAGGKRVYANRAICTSRCPALFDMLWKKDEFMIGVMDPLSHSLLTTVAVWNSMSIAAMKELVRHKTGIPAAKQRLMYNSTELKNQACISDHSLDQEELPMVHLVQIQTEEESGVDYEGHCTGKLSTPLRVAEFPDIDCDSLKAFLLYLYTAKVQITGSNVCGVYVLAKRFCKSLLRAECLAYLQRCMTHENALFLLSLARKQSCDHLRMLCEQFLTQNGLPVPLPEPMQHSQ